MTTLGPSQAQASPALVRGVWPGPVLVVVLGLVEIQLLQNMNRKAKAKTGTRPGSTQAQASPAPVLGAWPGLVLVVVLV